MIGNKYYKYLILTMFALSTLNHYAAFGIGVLTSFWLLKKDAAGIMKLVMKQKAILFMAAAMLLSTIFSQAAGYSLLIDLVILLHLLIYIALVKWVDQENIVEVLKFLNVMGILISLYGIYQYITGDLSINKSWTDTSVFGSLTRIYSTLRNPNIFAAYLTFNLCLAVPCFLRKKADALTSANIILASVCLILTYSRGGFIAFAAGMVVIILVSNDIKAAVYLTAMIFMYFGYSFLQNTSRAYMSAVVLDSSSLYRMEIWKAAWALFKENIVFGGGPGSVTQLLSYSSDKLKGYIFHAHNIPLHILAETGVVGFTAFVTLVGAWLKSGSQYLKQQRRAYSYLALGFVGTLTAMLVHGMVDCAIFIPSRSLVFTIYLALFPAIFIKSGSSE